MSKMKIGGQAVLEGVMIRSKSYYSTAVRNEKGKIVTQVKKIKKKPKWYSWPFIRGVVNLFEMLIIGMKSLTWSSNVSTDNEDEKLEGWQIFSTLAIAFAFAIGLFVALPYFLSTIIGFKEEANPVIFNIVDGIIKIIIFFLYLWIISFMKEIKRTFEYHGAEHMSVYCYEDGKALTVKNVKKYPTQHPRCGTNFMFIVIIMSIFVFSFIPVIVSLLIPNFDMIPFFLRKVILFFVRIGFIPVVASLSYEFLKLGDLWSNNIIGKIIAWPGMMFQNITTSQPDNKQIEVAIASAKLVLKKEKLIK